MRAVLLVAAFVLAGPALAEERVLYCTETASAGFIWEEGQTEGQVTNFTPNRYIVKVLSAERRRVTPTVGDSAGQTETLTCGKAFPYIVPDLLACDDGSGTIPWVFRGNKFVRAFLSGPPVGGGDPNIIISYGTCTGY